MKRLVTIILSLVLILSSLFCITVSAVDFEDVDITQKGSVKIIKYDINTVEKDSAGNIIKGDKLQGATFSAYRILDFDGKSYSVNELFKDDDDKAIFDLDKILYTGSTDIKTEIAGSYGSNSALEAQIPKIKDWILSKSVTAKKEAITDDNGEAEISELPLGVYIIMETNSPKGYVISTQPFIVSLPTWNTVNSKWIYDIEAKPKNESVSLKKELAKADNPTEMTNSDSYSIGENIPYTVTAKIPNYGQAVTNALLTVEDNKLKYENGVEKFNKLRLVLKDTLSKGLTADISSLKIKVDNYSLSKGDSLKAKTFNSGDSKVVETTGGDYTAELIDNEDGTKALLVTISWSAVDAYQGKDIVMTYNAQLNTQAVVGSANTNKIEYEFSIDPQISKRNTISDDTEVYTYQLDLTKTFDNKSAEEAQFDASKVVFQLLDKDSKAINVIKLADGSYAIWNVSTEGSTEGSTESISATNKPTKDISPTEEGNLSIKGFKEGEYFLEETKTDAGCILLASKVHIWVYEVKNTEDTALVANVKAHTMKYDESTEKYIEDTDNDLADDKKVGVFNLTVNNKPYKLPITGDVGICLITVVGLAGLTLSIMIFLHSKKKRQK